MRKGLAAAAVLAALLSLAPAALAQQRAPQRELTIHNETDQPLRLLYAMPAGSAEQGPDRLGEDSIAPGGSFRARLGRHRECLFDLRAVFDDGTEEERQRHDLCRNPRVTFGDPAIPWREAEVTNATGLTLRELYAAPPGAADWGRDRLGAEVMAPGASFRLRLKLRDCQLRLRAVYEDDQAEEREEVELCAAPAPARIAFDGSAIPRLPLRSLLVLNRHLAAVREAYLSASSDTDWGPDRLGGESLSPGEERELEMNGPCGADLRIVFANGAAEERRDLDICMLERVVLRPGWTVAEHPEEGAPRSRPQAPPAPGSTRLRNAAAVPLAELYIAPADAPPGAPPGPDRLGRTVLGSGESLDFTPPEGECRARLSAVFRDGRKLVLEEVDLCAGRELELR